MISSSSYQHIFDEDDTYNAKFFQSIAIYSLQIEFLMAKIGAVLNILHIFILTRKSMMISSVNSIMIGIAICDCICMIIIVKNGILVRSLVQECAPPLSQFEAQFDFFLTAVHNALRRCSAWLGMLVAVVRYFVIRNVTNIRAQVSIPKYGVKVSIIAFFTSCVASIFFYFHVDILEVATWTPKSDCEDFTDMTARPVHGQVSNEIFEWNNALFAKLRLYMECVFSKLITCFALPILSGLLITEMKKSAEVSIKSFKKSRKDLTTVITICIAISYFVSEFPLGIIYFYKAVWRGNLTYLNLAENVKLFCHSLFTINASIHCLICFSMSHQYRKTFFKCLKNLNCLSKKVQEYIFNIIFMATF
ncbi:G-protein coupled receptors family 1 profile domain-containing protein [Caenorhabditis elegans]|uniref:G-protein coupled receptors family 1 profile domain-containing protein n=1 Tax=Caenorhabditis elegans TaxID=6239 RepID=Q86DC3_CAEEL|nr:G-protein coupled receptors family 1 profile domain-containing protein [Caenorhabditis elegans]CCD61379.1 G-protein coupled receptors family 1 profile domain-containing protein [Caenorhabditis elegans]|eukprot:NP_001024046.1 Serpentine Receptor, class W [Caenorhabditis elegans]